MSKDIPESDWRRFRRVRDDLLDRYCAHVLEEVTAIAREADWSAYARYIKIFKLLKSRDEDLGLAFNDVRRSTAVMRLGAVRALGLLTDEELGGFSQETQEAIRAIDSVSKRER